MLESFLAVPLHFTIEFLGFLVAAGGALLVLSRPVLVPGDAAGRITVAIGFIVLAAAQVGHGGSFRGLETDGATILVAARTLGLAFILVGLVGSLRSGAAAVAGWRLEDPLLLAPAGASLLIALAALSGSRGSGPKSLRRLAVAALLLGASEVLVAADPDALFGTGFASSSSSISHGVKALGFIVMGAWFWSAVRSSIRARFVASFAALLVAVVLALASALTGVISENVQEGELQQVRGQARSVVKDFGDQATELKKDLGQIAQLDTVREATPNQYQALAQQLRRLQIFEFDFIMFMDPRGRILGVAGEGPTVKRGNEFVPTELGRIGALQINGSAVINDIVRSGRPFSASPAQVGDSSVAIMAANELTAPEAPSRRIGIVAVGDYIDALTMEEISSTLQPAKASLVVGGKIVATQLPGKARSAELTPRDARTDLDGGPVATEQTTIGGRSYSSAFASVESLGGVKVATFVLSTPGRVLVRARQGLTTLLFIVAMGVAAIALALAWFSGRRITRPIQELTITVEAVREGDLSAEARVTGEDEVGRLGETFNEMTASLLRMTDDLRDAAHEEQRLRGRIETIIESMADGLVAVDGSRHVLAFNREAENLTGIPSKEAMGRHVREVLKARDSQGQEVPLPIFDLVQGSVDNIFLERRGGDSVPVTIVSAPLPGDGDTATGGVLVMRDMTREREVERMKTEFLSNISHELRTPLTPIKGYAEILGRKNVPIEKVQKFVGGILDSTARLERIVQLLVDFSAMEAGRLAPRNTTIDITNLVAQLADEWAGRSDKHAVVADISAQIPLVVGDERLLRRSLEEVLDNAIKFSPSGGTITLEVKSNGHADRSVEVTVRDEGIGIPAEDIPKIFSDFQQLDGSETRTFGGLGLGLAFVQRIVQAHQGSVTVESELERGTRLTIAIPAAREASAD